VNAKKKYIKFVGSELLEFSPWFTTSLIDPLLPILVTFMLLQDVDRCLHYVMADSTGFYVSLRNTGQEFAFLAKGDRVRTRREADPVLWGYASSVSLHSRVPQKFIPFKHPIHPYIVSTSSHED